ncbi:MAG TPA: cobalamin-dependent protein [Arenibaculum sp.]|nr:cobalamin-dependent protein [Arenibaculum sp.]
MEPSEPGKSQAGVGRVVLVVPGEQPLDALATCRAPESSALVRHRDDSTAFFTGFDRRPREHLGVASLAAVLRRAGYVVRMIHCGIEGLSTEATVRAIADFRPDWIGISLSHALQTAGALAVGRYLRYSGVRAHLTLGGPAASLGHRGCLGDLEFVDSVIVGEAERSVVRLVDTLAAGGDWASVAGVASRDGGEVRLAPSDGVVDLADLPFPERDALTVLKRGGQTSLVASVYASRAPLPGEAGDDPSFATRWRPAEQMVEEIQGLVRDFGISRISYVDGDFLDDGEQGARLERFARTLIDRGLRVEITAAAQADSVKPELLALLSRAGLRHLTLYASPGHDAPERRELVERGISACREAGVEIVPAVQLVGVPATAGGMRGGLDFIRRNRLERSPSPFLLLNRLELVPVDPTSITLRWDCARDRPIGDEIRLHIDDARTQALWHALRTVCVVVHERAEHQSSALAICLRRRPAARRDAASAPQGRSLAGLRGWRANLGDLFLEIVQTACRTLEAAGPEAGLEDESFGDALLEALWSVVDAYDHRWLGTTFRELVETAFDADPVRA